MEMHLTAWSAAPRTVDSSSFQSPVLDMDMYMYRTLSPWPKTKSRNNIRNGHNFIPPCPLTATGPYRTAEFY